jgi:hypothetical protein
MFWKKTEREARRQRVLDELMELEPEGRRRRLDAAVAEGDVKQGEVEQALRLVERLDALRVMNIPGSREDEEPASTADAEPAEGEPAEGEPADADAQAAPLKSRMRRRQRARRRARAIEMTLVAATAEQALEKVVAIRRAGRAAGPRRRRGRMGPARRVAPRLPDAGVMVGPSESAAAPASAEQWPNIAWLRP